MQKKQFDSTSLTAGLLLAATALLNIVSLFFLPSTLSPVFFAAQRISTLSFLAGGILLVGVCGIMAVFGPKPKKWIAMEAALAALNVVLVLYNLFVR